MIKKFRTSRYGLGIEEIEIERETEHSVWVTEGNRSAKFSDWTQYHETYDQAFNHLNSVYTRKFMSAQSRLDTATNELEAVKLLSPSK